MAQRQPTVQHARAVSKPYCWPLETKLYGVKSTTISGPGRTRARAARQEPSEGSSAQITHHPERHRTPRCRWAGVSEFLAGAAERDDESPNCFFVAEDVREGRSVERLSEKERR